MLHKVYKTCKMWVWYDVTFNLADLTVTPKFLGPVKHITEEENHNIVKFSCIPVKSIFGAIINLNL